MLKSLAAGFFLFAALAGCANVSHTSTSVPAPAVPLNVHWYRDSAEQKAVYIETYRAAAAAARNLSHDLPPRSWGVILDIDETVLDNSDYEKSVAGVFNASLWDAWIERRAATRLPGAKEFIDTVREELHGQVILITNRRQSQCPGTEDNLRMQAITYDRILCNPTGDPDKNPRFKLVEDGTPGAASPVNVLIWVGDNIRDFPALTQASATYTEFGVHYFALPNPIYGSWMQAPYR
jgi:5'-nucleotidase (lipoprotein e(P4) family)